MWPTVSDSALPSPFLRSAGSPLPPHRLSDAVRDDSLVCVHRLHLVESSSLLDVGYPVRRRDDGADGDRTPDRPQWKPPTQAISGCGPKAAAVVAVRVRPALPDCVVDVVFAIIRRKHEEDVVLLRRAKVFVVAHVGVDVLVKAR